MLLWAILIVVVFIALTSAAQFGQRDRQHVELMAALKLTQERLLGLQVALDDDLEARGPEAP